MNLRRPSKGRFFSGKSSIARAIEDKEGGELFMNVTPRGDNFFYGTAGPGTTVVTATPATLKRVIWGGTYVGTIAVHDAATAAGTNGSSNITTIGIPLLRYPDSIEVNLHCKYGIVAEETGTPVHRLIWSSE